MAIYTDSQGDLWLAGNGVFRFDLPVSDAPIPSTAPGRPRGSRLSPSSAGIPPAGPRASRGIRPRPAKKVRPSERSSAASWLRSCRGAGPAGQRPLPRALPPAPARQSGPPCRRGAAGCRSCGRRVRTGAARAGRGAPDRRALCGRVGRAEERDHWRAGGEVHRARVAADEGRARRRRATSWRRLVWPTRSRGPLPAAVRARSAAARSSGPPVKHTARRSSLSARARAPKRSGAQRLAGLLAPRFTSTGEAASSPTRRVAQA